MCDNSTIEFADKPPLKTPMCYSINQVEVLQLLGNYTFASRSRRFYPNGYIAYKEARAVFPRRGVKNSDVLAWTTTISLYG